jgi:hypothetical protein
VKIVGQLSFFGSDIRAQERKAGTAGKPFGHLGAEIKFVISNTECVVSDLVKGIDEKSPLR